MLDVSDTFLDINRIFFRFPKVFDLVQRGFFICFYNFIIGVTQLAFLAVSYTHLQEEKRKSELDALQSQINPHFLYNTLDSIVWMIEGERYELSLIHIYR